MDKKCGIYTMEFYLAIKKKKFMSFVAKWMALKNVVLSEIIQSQEVKGHMFFLICGS